MCIYKRVRIIWYIYVQIFEFSVLTLKTKGAFDVSDIYFTSHDSHMLLLGSKGFSIYQHVKGGFLAQ